VCLWGPRHAGVCWGLIYATDGDTNLNRHSHKSTIYPIKLKESYNRPGVTHKVPEGLGSQISMTFGT